MRKYDSTTDYPILEAAAHTEMQETGSRVPSIVAVATALQAAGIHWPHNWNNDNSPSSLAIDRDISRANASFVREDAP